MSLHRRSSGRATERESEGLGEASKLGGIGCENEVEKASKRDFLVVQPEARSK